MSRSAASGSSAPSAQRRLARRAGAILGLLWIVLPLHTSAEEATPPPAVAPAAPRADLAPARELVRSGKLDEADQLLVQLQQSHPDDPALLLLRGEILNSSGKPAEAIGPLRHAAELAPQKTRIHFNLGAALASTGDSTGALAAFGKEIEINTDPKVKALARINRSILFQKDKKLTEAAAEIEEALVLDPERRDAYGDLIDLYVDSGHLDDAARAADRALEAGSCSARSCYRVGVAFFNQKAAEKAVKYFQKSIELQPDLAQGELALARALDQMEKRAEAEPHYKRYLELRPDAPEANDINKRLKPAPRK